MIKALAVCFIMSVSTFGGTAEADDVIFDADVVKAKYSIRDYVYQPLPESGYNYFKIAENAYFVHDDFENMVLKKIVFEVAQSQPFHAMVKETQARYADGSEHWVYKETVMNAAEMCAAKFNERWAGRVRNVQLNSVENFQMKFM